MTLATAAFRKFREKALAERKEKYSLKHNLEVSTTKEIAEALKRTNLIPGK
jgi:hypothetical protein